MTEKQPHNRRNTSILILGDCTNMYQGCPRKPRQRPFLAEEDGAWRLRIIFCLSDQYLRESDRYVITNANLSADHHRARPTWRPNRLARRWMDQPPGMGDCRTLPQRANSPTDQARADGDGRPGYPSLLWTLRLTDPQVFLLRCILPQ